MEQYEEIRKKIREAISAIEESDLIYKNKENWNDAKTEIKANLSDLLNLLDKDDYKDGLDLIDKVISSLKSWKEKIEKRLDN